MTPLLAVGAVPFGVYVYDIYMRPQAIAREARAFADSRGKPLLNVGAGTRKSSARVFIFGNTAWGDINTDLTGTGVPRLGHPDHVYRLDVMEPFSFPDKYFGAIIASHCLEQVPDPRTAMREMERVADKVFLVNTSWWDFLSWMHPDQRWLWKDGTFVPIDKPYLGRVR
jgi:hypothetical protein